MNRYHSVPPYLFPLAKQSPFFPKACNPSSSWLTPSTVPSYSIKYLLPSPSDLCKVFFLTVPAFLTLRPTYQTLLGHFEKFLEVCGGCLRKREGSSAGLWCRLLVFPLESEGWQEEINWKKNHRWLNSIMPLLGDTRKWCHAVVGITVFPQHPAFPWLSSLSLASNPEMSDSLPSWEIDLRRLKISWNS